MGFPDGGRNMSETIRGVIVYFCVLQRLGASEKLRKRLLASSCLSVRMEQLGSHWTDLHEI